jgi:hypothetical protein
MRILVFFLFLQILNGFVTAQRCMTKSDFAKIQKLNVIEVKKYLKEIFYNTTVNEFSNRPPVCAEDRIEAALGFRDVGFEGSCFEDYSNYNCFVVYQIKSNSPILLYECEESCYYSLLNDCKRTLKGDKPGSTDFYDFVAYPIGELTLEFREYYNDATTYRVLLYNKSQVQILWTQQHKKYLDELNKQQEEAQRLLVQEQKSDSIQIIAERLFQSEQYLDAKIKFQEANVVLPSPELASRIANCDQMNCLRLIKSGDQFLSKKQFKEALSEYEKTKDCLTDISIAEQKIQLVQKQMLNDSIVKIVAEADLLFSAKKFSSARELYLNVKRLDSKSNYANQKIKAIDDILIFLAERRVKTYDYAQFELFNYTSNKVLLQKHLIQYVAPLKKGELNIHINYMFDTLGINKSSFTVEGESSKSFKPSFEALTKQFQMTPPVKTGYFISASSQSDYMITWHSDEAKYRYTSKGIKLKSGFEQESSAITKYLSAFNTYGTYTIQAKSIQVNNDVFSNINVASYKAKAGPTNVIYSMILPGLGTKRVTYGEKGTGRMIGFLVTGALAYGAKMYSNQQYNLYLTSSGNESLTYYDRANVSNKIFVSSLGFATTIYVYDIFYVVGRGFKNMKKNKPINSSIPKYPPIISQELILKN